MEAKGVKRIRYAYQILKYSKVCGPCFQLWSPQGPQSGAPVNKAGPPFQPLQGAPVIVLDWSQQFQAIWANLASFSTLSPLETPSKLVLGDFNFPHGLQAVTAKNGQISMGWKGQ
ncbi:hypothetical protein O181_080460 [Austropuccinia psidii MF-1]|uniref:Uncharacterized protein n=1 Tax=Austropuccinia psidii MF-1 TaxID=1389203 RepID=A0A9Q3IIX1_9BASI|nr:hypothetical protein [Austropuccinia psidii MF-1]